MCFEKPEVGVRLSIGRVSFQHSLPCRFGFRKFILLLEEDGCIAWIDMRRRRYLRYTGKSHTSQKA